MFSMSTILGYGEDALTLWSLKGQLKKILNIFKDNTKVKDCLVFYRPSFGRTGGKNSAEFGEFDAIVASKEKYYLIESKWDNHSNYKKESIAIREEQALRHEVFTWYLFNWGLNYAGDWQKFKEEKKIPLKYGKTIPPAGSLQAKNLEYILSRLVNYCDCVCDMSNVRNVLLFFYDSTKSEPPTKTNGMFTIIPIDYGKYSIDNFINI
jgi:hypothetical protein